MAEGKCPYEPAHKGLEPHQEPHGSVKLPGPKDSWSFLMEVPQKGYAVEMGTSNSFRNH